MRGYPEGSHSGRRHLDFDCDGKLAVGFVVRKGSNPIGAPEGQPLFWRVQAFDREGQPVWQREAPTKSWNDNELFTGGRGTLLIRTPNDLTLLSEKGERIAERPLPEGRVRWAVLTPPDGRFFVVEAYPGVRQVTVLDPANLGEVATCSAGQYKGLSSAADHSAPLLDSDLAWLRKAAGGICGPFELAHPHTPNDPPAGPPLDGSRRVLAGPTVKGPYDPVIPVVALQEGRVERWRDAYRKNENVGHVRVGGNGSVFAVLVQTYAGGSRILDMNGHRTKARIVVYRPEDGRRLMEVPIVPLPPERLGTVLDFAISRDGQYLGILSDSTLRWVPISTGERDPSSAQ